MEPGCSTGLREQVVTDLPQALALLTALPEQVAAVTAHIQGLLQRVRAGVFPTAKGLSFLVLRPQLLLFYLQDLAAVLAAKAGGRPLAGTASPLRLAELRTVLEKMRPIDHKLRYQVDKLVRAAATGALGGDDPLRFRPDPSNMASKLSEDEEEVASGPDPGKKPAAAGGIRKYIPPRLVPVHYDEGAAARAQRRQEQATRRALSSSVIRELRDQFSEAPEEIREGMAPHAARHSREETRRTQYEESMLVRLGRSRQEQAWRRKESAPGAQLGALTRFGDISALTGPVGTAGETRELSPPRKRKKISVKKGKKKGTNKFLLGNAVCWALWSS
ncbi:neuroguidin [Alligator mississippiensis]|uniref:Neuroguidin n=1 Tax=Alligator mississippiensis TaxID=8496 RepID=A0A151NQ22_ALLMI|nr:neuroguidin [Alligator mississippiensis]